MRAITTEIPLTERLSELQHFRMKALVADYERRGSTAILDRACDREFCQDLEFNYGDKYIYSRIDQFLALYRREC